MVNRKILKPKPEPRLTGEQIVKKKLDGVNPMLKRMDLSKLSNKPSASKE